MMTAFKCLTPDEAYFEDKQSIHELDWSLKEPT